MKQLYQLYLSNVDWLYKENSTDYILTLDKLADVLVDKRFNDEYDYHFEDGIESYCLMQPDNLGRIPIRLTCLDDGDFVSRDLTLVPVYSFIS